MAGGTAQGPSRERVCRVSGGEQGQTSTVESVRAVPFETGCIAMTAALTSGVGSLRGSVTTCGFDLIVALPYPSHQDYCFFMVLEMALSLFCMFLLKAFSNYYEVRQRKLVASPNLSCHKLL